MELSSAIQKSDGYSTRTPATHPPIQLFTRFYPHHLIDIDDTEANIQAAIKDYNACLFKSHRAAADAYNVKKSTLRDRINGKPTRAIAHFNQQRLTPDQEQYLVQWILHKET